MLLSKNVKRKTDSENRTFKEEWRDNFMFILCPKKGPWKRRLLAWKNRSSPDADVMIAVLEELTGETSMDGVVASVKQVPLSARSANHCIEASSKAVQSVVISDLNQADYFSIAVDESR